MLKELNITCERYVMRINNKQTKTMIIGERITFEGEILSKREVSTKEDYRGYRGYALLKRD